MKRTGIIFILGLLLASLSWAQNGDNPAFDSVTFPVFSLNPAPVPGASIALVGQPGQATWYFWASANYQLGIRGFLSGLGVECAEHALGQQLHFDHSDHVPGGRAHG